jgi:ribosomal-protein-alanine N-acetyltransferase
LISLRKLTHEDVAWIVEAGMDPAIQEFTLTGGARTSDAAIALIEQSNGDLASWGIVVDMVPVGVISLHKIENEEQAADIGYWISPQWRRRGYARKALLLLEDELRGIPGVTTIQLRILERNEPSHAMARSAGYVQKASSMCSCGAQGEVVATVFEKHL